jgi:hypothetical protein
MKPRRKQSATTMPQTHETKTTQLQSVTADGWRGALRGRYSSPRGEQETQHPRHLGDDISQFNISAYNVGMMGYKGRTQETEIYAR